MTFFDCGLAIVRIGEQHPDLKGTARHVFGVMCSMVGSSERDKSDPQCFASQQTIAERVGCSVRSVGSALAELERIGAIERAGRAGARLHATVRWRLPLLLRLSADSADKEGSADSAEKQSANSANKQSAKFADKSSDSQRPPGSGEEGSAAAGAAAPPGGSASAAAPSMNPGRIIGEIMEALDYSREMAEDWAKRKLTGAVGPVRNETAFLRTCLENELRPASRASAKTTKPTAAPGHRGKKPPKGVPTEARRAAATRRTTPAQRERAVRRVLSKEATVAEIAAEFGNSKTTVGQWVAEAKNSAILRVLGGRSTPATEAEILGCPSRTFEWWVVDYRDRMQLERIRRASRDQQRQSA